MATPRRVILRRSDRVVLARRPLTNEASLKNDEEELLKGSLTDSGDYTLPRVHKSYEPSLCFKCASALLRRDTMKEIMGDGIVFTGSPKHIQESAHLCSLCSIFQKLISRPGWDFLTGLRTITLTISGEQVRKVGGQSVLLSIDLDHLGREEFWVARAFDDRGIPLPAYAEKEKLKVASDIFQDCVTNHKDCPLVTATPLPTRVLDVEAEDVQSDIRLFESNGTQASYATLSYCWGGSQDMALSKSRLLQYRNRIALSSLPQTIQDAVQTTRALNVRYLWIDAYCIIQDCDEDKAKEISNMHRVYENSSFTIAAADAPNAKAGFLNRQSQLEAQELLLMLWNGRPAVFILEPTTRNIVKVEALNRRAWTLQECLLARRLVWFGSERAAIEWHCGSVREDEKGVLEEIFPNDRFFDNRLLQRALKKQDRTTKIPVRHLCRDWAAIVGAYSQRALSDPSDKLSALAGVAAVFHNVWGGSYYAGLWSQFLIPQLLWFCNTTYSEPDTYPRAPPHYRAPSWSWASVDGKIAMSQYPVIESHGLEFVSCDVTLAHAVNPFGPVLAGQLRLKGLVKQCLTDEYLFDLTCTERSRDHQVGYPIFDSTEYEYQKRQIWCLAVERPRQTFGKDPNSDYENDTDTSQSSRDRSGSWKGLLMLRKENDPGGSLYVRIGMFSLYKEDWFDGCTPQFLTIE